MKRKLMEKKNERAIQVKAMEDALANGDTAAFETAKSAVGALNGEIERMESVIAEKSRFGTDPEQIPDMGEPKPEKKASGMTAMLKMLRGEKLSEKEQPLISKALITGDNAVSGENYLVPEDVKLEIRELRKTYVSAKDIVNVVQTDALTGSTNFENGAPSGLTDFADGDEIAADENPTFVKKSWKIGFRGKLIPISRVLSRLAGGLMSYLNRWFVKNAIISENTKIFSVLQSGYNEGTPKVIAGWKALKHSILVDLDPSCLNGGMIVTNQSGFACLDEEEDSDGRPILQPNPANPTQKLFQGLPIVVFPDAQLANIDGTHFPVIYGDTKAGADFIDFEGLLFDVSEHYLFNKNQNCLRVIEGFDVVSTDTGAYIYGSFSATV